MSILKYYKVDSDGKIKRLRRECPTAECGAGIFVSPMPFPPSAAAGLVSSFRWPSIKIVSTVESVG